MASTATPLKFARDPWGFNDWPRPCDACKAGQPRATGLLAPVTFIANDDLGQLVQALTPLPQSAEDDLPGELRSPEPEEVAACTPLTSQLPSKSQVEPLVSHYDTRRDGSSHMPDGPYSIVPARRSTLDRVGEKVAIALAWPIRLLRSFLAASK
jgi:hypothetical protein